MLAQFKDWNTLITDRILENTLELKDVLYDAISHYGEKRIFSDIVQGDSPEVISTIIEHCLTNLEKIKEPKPEMRGTLAEGLLHYLLTIALIPSQRKTSFESVDIDVAIPDTKTLSSSPEDVVLISFPKTDNPEIVISQINKIKRIQPNKNNIWVVLDDNLPLDAKVYSIKKDGFTFANIINDLISFSSNKKQSKLKIFKI